MDTRLSELLRHMGFLCVAGTTERTSGPPLLVRRGTPFTFATNNGVIVIYDEHGWPYLMLEKQFKEIKFPEHIFTPYNLELGAYVPHSNDGGWFKSALERPQNPNILRDMALVDVPPEHREEAIATWNRLVGDVEDRIKSFIQRSQELRLNDPQGYLKWAEGMVKHLPSDVPTDTRKFYEDKLGEIRQQVQDGVTPSSFIMIERQ